METKKTRKPGWVLLFLGVIYPAGVIGFELYSRMCAETFFDPIPTIWHVLLVLLVPLSNCLLWIQLREKRFTDTRWLILSSAISIGIAGFYAILFLPLTPISVMAIVIFGMGFLSLAPLIVLFVTIKLYRNLVSQDSSTSKTKLWHGLLIALFAFVILDLPTAATKWGITLAASDNQTTSRRGIELLRRWGDEELLLRHCYDRHGQATGPLSFALIFLQDRGSTHPSKVREIFYRVTGEPFNLQPIPHAGRAWRQFEDMNFDADQGGTQVGGRLKGLNLVSSRLDGSVNSDDGIAYLEWTFEFRNDSYRQREARLQISLPPDAVVSRATLWINGEESEAAFAGRRQVRQAYQSIVQRRRDPLLVTTQGTDRILAQAFPILPNGGLIKFRLGMTAPLKLIGKDSAQLILPAIENRNFNIDRKLQHEIWIEAHQSLRSDLSGVTTKHLSDQQLYRIQGSLSDMDLTISRKSIWVDQDETRLRSWSELEPGEAIIQQLVMEEQTPPEALMLVIDGSAKMHRYLDAIVAALDRIPDGTQIGLIIASEAPASITIGAWTEKRKAQFKQLIEATDFAGGQDSGHALTDALHALESYSQTELLWVHAPQPVAFTASQAKLDQAMTRLSRTPKIVLYGIGLGPNLLMDNADWSWQAKALPYLGMVEKDLADYFDSLFSTHPGYQWKRFKGSPGSEIERGSAHIVRLWAKTQVLSLITEDKKGNTDRAIEIAARHQLVTPVSGAVVLESQAQYEENDLTPVEAGSVPTIPEPHQWLLLFVILALILWYLRQHRHRLTGIA